MSAGLCERPVLARLKKVCRWRVRREEVSKRQSVKKEKTHKDREGAGPSTDCRKKIALCIKKKKKQEEKVKERGRRTQSWPNSTKLKLNQWKGVSPKLPSISTSSFLPGCFVLELSTTW